MKAKAIFATAVAFLCFTASHSVDAGDLTYEWYPIANNGDDIPDTTKHFNSYNQPAVNKHGMVVFRARSKGGEGAVSGEAQPARGVYARDFDEYTYQYGDIFTIFKRDGLVPEPVNPGENGMLPTFNEFPSVPRIDSGSDTIATRGQSKPVWFDPVTGKTGTAGVYTNPGGVPTTGASMLGDVTGFEYFQVPVHGDVRPGTGFDQFPGSPAVTERRTIVFKGNFAVEGQGKTGVFYRDVLADDGVAPIELIASSFTKIPGCKANLTTTPPRTCEFGSTAPPSAGGKYAVFAGYDNEAAPTVGGIYRAYLGVKPITLETVVKIGAQVPGEKKGVKFEAFGEAVSMSSTGRLVLFWGGWGGKHAVPMVCPDEGGVLKKEACLKATSIGDPEKGIPADPDNEVPNYQGFFVRDMQLGTTTVIAKTNEVLTDFVYWNFSGRIEGMGEGGDDIEEPARWRSATYAAVSGNGVPNVSAFKAKTVDGKDGIFLRKVLPSGMDDLVTLLETGDSGAALDPMSPGARMEISALGIERDGFRGNWLAITVSMVPPAAATLQAAGSGGSEEVTGWAGVYAAHFLGDELEAPVSP
jgi:hypothetical protein